MKLSNLYEQVLNEYSGHKIPVGEIFLNDNIHGGPNGPNWDLGRKIDIYVSDSQFESLPIKDIDVRRIVPTQKFITKDNLESVKDNLTEDNTGAYIVELDGMFYILDGHHRIANRIINGFKTIKAYVYIIKT